MNFSTDSNSMQTTRLYHLYHSFWRHDYDVTAADKQPLYHVNNSLWTPNKPDLTLHNGRDNKGPIMAACKFKHLSRHCNISLGDPNDANNTLWEILVGQGLTHGKYRWQMPTRNSSARPAFLWKRTGHVGVASSSPSLWSQDNYKLVDERTNAICAVYTSSAHKSIDKSGKLEVLVDHGPGFDVMVLITVLALIEKHRRRRNSSASGGDGGGGGG